MNIVQITGMRSTKFGGLERFFLEMAKILQKRGDTLYLIYNEQPRSGEYISKIQETGTEIIIMDFNAANVWSMIKNFVKLIRYTKADIVHFHFGAFSHNYFILPRLLGVKKIYRTIHSTPFNSSKISIYSKIRYKLMNMFHDRLLPVSESIKEDVLKVIHNDKKISMRYLGTFINELTEDEKTIDKENAVVNICCIAFHQPVKGIDILLKAIHQLKYKYNFKAFKLTQIGGGYDDYKQELEKQCEQLNIQEEVIWYGLTDNVPSVLAGMDIYVQPSRSEGIGIALMEAASQKLPLIGSNIGGIPEIVIDECNGFLFPVEDSESLAEKLHILCLNKDLRKEMGENSRRNIEEKFNLKTNTIQLINELY